VSKGRRLPALGACLLIATLGAGSALGAGLKTGTSTAVIPGGAPFTGTATATCPGKSRIVSGGFQDLGHQESLTGPSDTAYSSLRVGRKAWRASADNFNLAVPGTLAVFAYCSKERSLKALKVRTASAIVPLNGSGVATARCPSGHKVVSGGFDFPGFTHEPGPGAFPFRSIKSGSRSWTVAADAGDNSGGTFVAYAYCRKGGEGLKARSAQVGVPAAPPALAGATAQCKSDETVLSGGFDQIGFGVPGGQYSFTYESLKVAGRSWRAAAENFGGPGTMRVYAYCQKK
jgi:hypothetical protein